MDDSTTLPRHPTIRVNLLRAHGGPSGYQYNKGCRCSACRSVRAASNAARHAANRTENLRRIQIYNDKHRIELRAQARLRQSRFFANLRIMKAAQGCIDCGRRDGPLDHHHVDPTAKVCAVSSMACSSFGRFLDEVAKCVVLCPPCHQTRHPGTGKNWTGHDICECGREKDRRARRCAVCYGHGCSISGESPYDEAALAAALRNEPSLMMAAEKAGVSRSTAWRFAKREGIDISRRTI